VSAVASGKREHQTDCDGKRGRRFHCVDCPNPTVEWCANFRPKYNWAKRQMQWACLAAAARSGRTEKASRSAVWVARLCVDTGHLGHGARKGRGSNGSA
jgi:hypothetical protein